MSLAFVDSLEADARQRNQFSEEQQAPASGTDPQLYNPDTNRMEPVPGGTPYSVRRRAGSDNLRMAREQDLSNLRRMSSGSSSSLLSRISEETQRAQGDEDRRMGVERSVGKDRREAKLVTGGLGVGAHQAWVTSRQASRYGF